MRTGKVSASISMQKAGRWLWQDKKNIRKKNTRKRFWEVAAIWSALPKRMILYTPAQAGGLMRFHADNVLIQYNISSENYKIGMEKDKKLCYNQDMYI